MIGYTQKQKIEQFPRVMRDRDRLDLMLHDVMNGFVTFGEWVREDGGKGKTRVGISNRAYPLAMVVWSYPGQSQSVQVHDLDAWEPELRELRARSDVWDPYVRALASAKDKLAQRVSMVEGVGRYFEEAK